MLELLVHSYALLYVIIGQPLTYRAATGDAIHGPERTTEDNIAVIAEFGYVRLQHARSASSPSAERVMFAPRPRRICASRP